MVNLLLRWPSTQSLRSVHEGAARSALFAKTGRSGVVPGTGCGGARGGEILFSPDPIKWHLLKRSEIEMTLPGSPAWRNAAIGMHGQFSPQPATSVVLVLVKLLPVGVVFTERIGAVQKVFS